MTADTPAMPVRSALAQAGIEETRFSGAGCELREITTAAVLSLRSLEPAPVLAPALKASGLELPLAVNGASGEDPSVLCLRPDEWLFVSETAAAGELRARIMENIDARSAFLLDCSDAHAVLRLTGAAAPWLLSKLGGLDYIAAAANGQHCARTRLSQAAVIVHCHAPVPGAACFDLLFDRSIAQYMWSLLKACAPHAAELERDFGVGRAGHG